MPRFFVAEENIDTSFIKITDGDAFHIARSLRMAIGDTVTVCDGKGTEYSARLIKIHDDECECEILESSRSTNESPVLITLFMAYPKSDKLETVIQKAVELGVYEVIPFESSRCIKRPKAEKQEKQNARLSKIAEEAAKQCGRGRLPKIGVPLSFGEMLKKIKDHSCTILCYEGEEECSLKNAVKQISKGDSVAVIIGSEGGFSPEEAALIKDHGALSVTLGGRILRCETAPLFVLSALSYELEL